MLVKTHHIISDGWTQVNLCNRLGQIYLDLLSGAEPDAGGFAGVTDMHIDAQREYLRFQSFIRKGQGILGRNSGKRHRGTRGD